MKTVRMTRRAALASMASLAVIPRAARAQSLEKVTVSLDWTPNTNHIGLYVAREIGFYREEGLDIEILPYSDASASTLVANGAADFGIEGTIGLLTQRAAGADLVGAYAITQTETGRLITRADRPDIKRPRDLDGKTYGGFGSAWENALIGTIIRHDGGKGQVETVTLGTSAYQALDAGVVDCTLEVYTWEGVQAERQGLKQQAFRYSDYGVPDEYTTLIVAGGKVLRDKQKAAHAFLRATRKGYAFAVDNPDAATDLLIAANSDALSDRAFVRASMQAIIDGHYFRGPDGAIGSFDRVKVNAIGNFLFLSQILLGPDGKPLQIKPDFGSSFVNLLQS